jgi:hypothetical protein
MPAAKGKTEIRVVLPDALKAELEQEAAEQGVDRSTWITMRLQTVDASGESGEVARRLSELARDSAVMREALTQLHEDLRQVVVLIEAFMAAVGKPATPAEKVYPTPATWEETYPELYAPTPPESSPAAVVVEPPAPAKRWGIWPR